MLSPSIHPYEGLHTLYERKLSQGCYMAAQHISSTLYELPSTMIAVLNQILRIISAVVWHLGLKLMAA